MSGPWFQTSPERCQYELEALSAAGIEYSIDSKAQAAGIFRLELRIAHGSTFALPDGEPLRLAAIYPDHFPYFRPEVFVSELLLPRHQHPFARNLCLLARSTVFWNPEWTLAALLQRQLATVLTAGRIVDPALLAETPGEQAEPFTDYLNYYPPAMVLVDGSVIPPAGQTQGRLVVGIPPNSAVTPQALLLELRGNRGDVIAKATAALAEFFPRRVEGWWYRLTEPPIAGDGEIVANWLEKQTFWQRRRGSGTLVANGTILGVTAVVFPSETSPGIQSAAWAFLIHVKVSTEQPGPRGKPVRTTKQVSYFAQLGQVGKQEALERAPRLRALGKAKIAVAGLGCLGAPSVLELARSGVGGLRLLDHDTVDPATTLRWPFGLPAFGKAKVEVLAEFINRNYPHIRIEQTLVHRIGAIRGDSSQRAEWQVLDQFLNGASLVFDASAEDGVSHFLSQLASERGLPYIMIYGTQGGWGGVVLRQVPGRTAGCWMCFKHALNDNTITAPPADASGAVQPLGCADPTFTGTSFDMQNIVLAGVRLAVATLCHNVEDGYEDLNWDVGVLALNDGQGAPIAPIWQTYKLQRHAACPYCEQG